MSRDSFRLIIVNRPLNNVLILFLGQCTCIYMNDVIQGNYRLFVFFNIIVVRRH